MENDIDLLLRRYAGELACYVRARDGLRPLSLRLTAAISQYLEHPWDNELLNQAVGLKVMHAHRRADLRDVFARWEQARGAGETLWQSLAAMSAAQTRRFDLLAAKERELAEEREEFEQVSRRLKGLLLLFSEMVV